MLHALRDLEAIRLFWRLADSGDSCSNGCCVRCGFDSGMRQQKRNAFDDAVHMCAVLLVCL